MLYATTSAGGTITLEWQSSPTEASRAVEYLVLRRASGTTSFAQIARTTGLRYVDAPAAGSYDYVVRTVVSTFTSADSPIASATAGP